MKGRRQKYNDDGKQDRLSDLPDSVVLHILSFLITKEAVQTCILSTRWKNLWKFLTTITVSTKHFQTTKAFANFVPRILSLRDASTALQALDFHRETIKEPYLLNRIIKYAVSHKVPRLGIHVTADIQRFPPCFFSCNTFTSLDLCVIKREYDVKFRYTTLFPNFLNLPALTSLSLQYFAFHSSDDGRVEPFSAFKMLNSLIIDHFIVRDAQILCISCPKLVNLTILRKCSLETNFSIELCAPCLHTFAFTSITILKLYGSKSNLSSIKHLNIDLIPSLWKSAETSLVLLSWLVEFACIESLTVSLSTLEVLSLVPDLLKVDFSSLSNLKSLNVNMYPRSSIPDGVVEFLLQNSPSTKIKIIN